jgi:hypothetical protein
MIRLMTITEESILIAQNRTILGVINNSHAASSVVHRQCEHNEKKQSPYLGHIGQSINHQQWSIQPPTTLLLPHVPAFVLR